MTSYFKSGISSSGTVTSMSKVDQQNSSLNYSAASDIDMKVRRGIGRVSENIHILANEPSLSLFCIQEHVRKEIPNMIKQKHEFHNQHRLLQGTSYDCDYGIAAVKSIEKSEEQFDSIQTHLKNALFLKQQLKYDENRRKANEKKRKF